MPHFTDPTYLSYQYADSEKLRIRQESHRLYSENPGDFFAWVLERLAPQPGELIADVGCGPGAYHPHLARRRVRVLAVDAFLGMVQDAARQAREQGLPVWTVQADATALPLADASCDRLMANHMLYHVTDKEAALWEMHRVLKPGGRVLLATNGSDNGARLRELHAEAARELGYTPAVGSPIAGFTLESGLDLVRRVFPNVRVETRPDAFRFPDVESVLRYYASMGVDQLLDPPPSAQTRAALVEQMRGKVQAILDREGVFRMAKTVGCFVAEKPIWMMHPPSLI